MSGAALLALTACGGGGDEGGDSGGAALTAERSRSTSTAPTATWATPLGEQFSEEGELAGMRGTTPLTELSADFTDRLLEVDPALQDFNYAGETYDAVVISALAAAGAGTNDANVFKRRTSTASPSVATSARTSPPASRSSRAAATSTTTASPVR